MARRLQLCMQPSQEKERGASIDCPQEVKSSPVPFLVWRIAASGQGVDTKRRRRPNAKAGLGGHGEEAPRQTIDFRCWRRLRLFLVALRRLLFRETRSTATGTFVSNLFSPSPAFLSLAVSGVFCACTRAHRETSLLNFACRQLGQCCSYLEYPLRPNREWAAPASW